MYFLMIQLLVAVSLNYGLVSFDTVKYLDTNQGQITSPGYPGNYPNNVNYTWVIRTGHNSTYLTFIIHDMDLPCGDYFKIKEVDPCCHTAFYRCGILQEMTVYARGKQISIYFISDNKLRARGFNLSWTESTKLTTKESPNITKIQAPASKPIIQKSTTLDITFKYDATNVTFLEFQSSSGYMIIGICVFEALLIIIGVIIVKRFRSRASKDRIPRKRLADTDGLVTPSTDKGAEIAYELMPLECVLPSNVNENVKDVYAECPDNVYDSTLIRRPYVFQQNNIYQTNEGNYNASFSKRDRDINNDSNLYQSCD